MDNQSSVVSLWERLKEFLTLKYEYARLTLAEKITMLLAVVAMSLIALFMVTFAIFFLSMALSHWLSESIGLVWSSMIVAGVYLLILLIVFALRKQLLINPISRFITRLFS